MFSGRFKDVGSRMNWLRCLWLRFERRLLLGKCLTMQLRRSGMILDLVSAVALQTVSKWIMSSAGAGCGRSG